MGDFCQRRPMLERVFAQADLMDRVMERVGVDAPTAARLDRGNFGWEALLYERGELLITNVPLDELQRAEQYVMNSTTGAWCRFTGLDAICWAVFQGDLYFGGAEAVFRADIGYLDDDEEIVADMLGAWTHLGRPGQIKSFTGIRPLLRTSVGAAPEVGISIDFKESDPSSAPTIAQTAVARWGIALWGLDVWGENIVFRTDWSGATGIGTYGAPRLRITTDPSQATELPLLLSEGGDELLLTEGGESMLLTEVVEGAGSVSTDVFQVLAFDIHYQPGGLI